MGTSGSLNTEEATFAEMLFAHVLVPTMARGREDGRIGAVLEIRSSEDEILFRIRSGDAPEDKWLSYEKAVKAQNDVLAGDRSMRTSWQVPSGDLTQTRCPGAVKTQDGLSVSIAGFTWQENTIASLWIAAQLNKTCFFDEDNIIDTCGINSIHFSMMMNALDAAMIHR